MSTEIATPENQSLEAVLAALTPAANPAAKHLATYARGNFLPRMQLEGSNSKIVKLGKITKGNYSLIRRKDDWQDLGKSVDMLVIDFRTKALDLSDPDNVVAYFDADSDDFRRVEELAKIKGQSQGYMYGMEFLVWLPSVNQFALWFFGNPTHRNRVNDMIGVLRRAATVDHEVIEGRNGFIWEGPTIRPCQTPLSSEPEGSAVLAEVQRFRNPTPVLESATAPADGDDEQER